MSTVVWRTESEGLPVGAEGFVVSRDRAGLSYDWTSVKLYRKTKAVAHPIASANMDAAIKVARLEADRKDAPIVYVMWG